MKKFFSLLAAVAMTFSVSVSAQDYIQQYGRLKLVGRQLSSESGQPVQLKGWSSFGWMSNWGDCHQKGHLEQMKRWGASIYRGAMYVAEGGYNNNKSGYTQQTKTFIDQTAELGMYYLCDWHVLTPGNPNDGTYSDAPNYFREISSYVKSKGYKHVIYEICNEPNGCSWSEIKQYADKVLPIIQQNDPGACVVVGTPSWDQEIDKAVSSPITNYNNLNILYAFHYYACSHSQFLGRLENAAAAIPVFISEWGIAHFSGGEGSRDISGNCIPDAEKMVNIAANGSRQLISWCAWSFGEKNEQASSLMSCGSMELSPSGNEIVRLIGKDCSDGSCDAPKTACYEGTCQEVPGVVDLGKYDMNPEAENKDYGFGKTEDGKTYVGGGEGVTYHEENTTDDEVNDRSQCNGAYMWAGADYAFRQDECVDASGCYGISNTEGWHNLGYIEPDEWLSITVDVKEPGYYSLKALCNPTTNQQFSINSVTHGGSLLYDMATEEPLTTIAFFSDLTPFNGENWNSWGWLDPVTDLDNQDDAPNHSVLFKEAGKHTIKISFTTGEDIPSAGDLGPLEFTLAKPYNGPGYGDASNNTDNYTLANDLVYPNPNNGTFKVAESGELTISNLVGEVIFSANVEANAEINANLATGNYIATVKTADAVKVAKVVIK